MAGRTIPPRPFDPPPRPVSRARGHEIDPTLREALWARCGGACEACGDPLSRGWHAHHRLRRSRGGDDSIYNLTALHPACHLDGIHRYVTRAEEAGFLLRTGQDPFDAPLALHFEQWVRLAVDGSYVLVGDAL